MWLFQVIVCFDSQLAVLFGLSVLVVRKREDEFVTTLLLQSTASKKSKIQSSSTSTSTTAAASKGKGVARVTRRSVANGNSSQPTLASMFAKM